MMHRQPGNSVRIERIHVGLATVPMAVTASSAFPGFFPPVELTGADVGASDGEFGRQAYTDGGVFDNLGVRMFRCLERPLLAESPLSADDFFDFQAVVETLREAGKSGEETPLRRLGQILVAARSRPDRPCSPTPARRAGQASRPSPGPGRWKSAPIAVTHQRPATARRGSRAVHSLGRFAPLPVAPRAALRRAEARRPRRGSAPPCQPFGAAASWTAAIRSG